MSSKRRRVLIVLRPTVSGIDEGAADRLIDGITAGTDADVRIAYLDVASPSVHEELDLAEADGAASVLLVPVAVPRDKYLITWTARAVANWRETRAGAAVNISIHEPGSVEDVLAGAVAGELGEPGRPITVSAASYRSPAWSVIEEHDRHVLVCKGPRCMAYGAGPLHRALTAASKGTSTKVTGTGCLSPCNLGPLAIENPHGSWFGHLTADHAQALVEGNHEDLGEQLLPR
ncbi:(2Fe-2S) ferredoxin [Rhodococcus sp. 27YEA15]|uniref:(2Fe-2S) ferredoxin domain-containing protein n=1 Tax=Rhodococcus sp. 27YEA15 TaxID=3156259 RepID=UPI003C7D8D4D